MKKVYNNKIVKILNKFNVELSYDEFKCNIYINNKKCTDKQVKEQQWFLEVKAKLNIIKDIEAFALIKEIAKEKVFNSEDIRLKENEAKEQAKLKEKEAKEQAKIEEREAKERAKLKEREAKERAKIEENEAKEQAKIKEKEAKERAIEEEQNKIESFISNFDFSLLDEVPASSYKDVIRTLMGNNGIKSTPQLISRILTKKTLKEALEQKQKYEELGYILDENDKIEWDNPINYDIFFENWFYDKDTFEKSKKERYRYCFYDDWKNMYNVWNGSKFIQLTDERMRNIVRSYSPIKNVYVVNDSWRDWVHDNRTDSIIQNYMSNLDEKWDGVDRLGINMDNNEMNDNDNVFLHALGIEQSKLNKKMFNYWFIHNGRQILWPTKYNFQHVLMLLGDTNCGKTKSGRDLFTFDDLGESYWCENLNLDDKEWTLAEKMKNSIAIIWSEMKGIGKAENDQVKQFIDIVNGKLYYQEKGKQQQLSYTSHNTLMISYNPNGRPVLTDYSVSWEKRYYILECTRTSDDFKDNHLNDINENKLQMWAQMIKWIKTNKEYSNELAYDDIEALKEVQKKYKGINSESIEAKLDYYLNQKLYVDCNIIDIEQIKYSDSMVKSHPKLSEETVKYHLNFIENNTFNDILKYIGYDSRHKSVLDMHKNLLPDIGWKAKQNKTINGRTYYGYIKVGNRTNLGITFC